MTDVLIILLILCPMALCTTIYVPTRQNNYQYQTTQDPRSFEIPQIIPMDSFNSFKMQQNRKYDTYAQECYRMLVYKQNIDAINLHNRQVYRKNVINAMMGGSSTYKKGFILTINKFADVSQRQFRQIYTATYPTTQAVKQKANIVINTKPDLQHVFDCFQDNDQTIDDYANAQEQALIKELDIKINNWVQKVRDIKEQETQGTTIADFVDFTDVTSLDNSNNFGGTGAGAGNGAGADNWNGVWNGAGTMTDTGSRFQNIAGSKQFSEILEKQGHVFNSDLRDSLFQQFQKIKAERQKQRKPNKEKDVAPPTVTTRTAVSNTAAAPTIPTTTATTVTPTIPTTSSDTPPLSSTDDSAAQDLANRALLSQVAQQKEVYRNVSIDWTQHAGTIRHQGLCGSCYAFSTADTVAVLYSIYRFDFFVPMSTQQLVDCPDNELTFGCDGGFLEGAYAYIQNNGLTTAFTYNYTGQQGTCKVANGTFKISSFKTLDPGCNILIDQLEKGPVAVGLAGYRLQFYSSGIFDDCNTFIDHAVVLIGYTKGVGWKIKNSWGTDWGMNGFAYLQEGNSCGICENAVSAQIQEMQG